MGILTGMLENWQPDTSGAELSRELRSGDDEALRRRRKVAALSMVSMGSMAVISLYQLGMIDHLPELPLPGLDADKIDAAGDAYQKYDMPDAVLGLHSYSTTLALAAAGGANRAESAPWIPLALAAKAAVDALQAGKLTVQQWTEHRAFCSWCLLAAGATFATLPLVLPEAQQAWDEVQKRL